MAPGGGGKRKRGDRTYSHDSGDGSRASPHRPGSLSLAQQNYQHQSLQQYGYSRDQQDQRGRGGRRGSRGGRGGPLRSPLDSPNAIPIQSRQGVSTSKAISSPRPPSLQRQPESLEASEARSPMPAMTAPQQTAILEPLTPPATYHYDYFTEDVRTSWQETGRNTLVEVGRQACLDEDIVALGCVFQEIIRSGIDGHIECSDAGLTIKDMLGEDANLLGNDRSVFDGRYVFLDCLSAFSDDNETLKSLKIILPATGISPHLMREELDQPFLEKLGLIRSTFSRMAVRHTTNLLYRQSNYNLLREETEGYSKLVTELFTTSNNEPPTAEVVEDTFERIKAMIGTFDLDVGRVLDVTLDVFAAVLVKQYRFFVKYLRGSSWWPQPALLEPTTNVSSMLGSLPQWALPDAAEGWVNLGDEERAVLDNARYERDTRFWGRVREIGTKAFYEIGNRRADECTLQTANNMIDSKDASQYDEDRRWIEGTGTLLPLGNKTAAQILGFKLRFYSSAARNPDDVLPINLIYLAALLIKIGFISLRDLYPHLWPADSDMDKVREEKMKEKAEREKLNRPGGGVMNALMTAGALVDDTLPNSGRPRDTDNNRGPAAKVEATADKMNANVKLEAVEDLPEPSDQKVQLLRSLLCIGAIPESLYILGRFPWLVDAFPDLPEHIHRILHHSLSKVYEPLRPLQTSTDLREQHKVVDPDQSGVIKGQLRQVDQPPRKVLRWAQLDKDDTNEGTDYRFYWDDWADNVPVCQTVDDVFSLCSTFLNCSGIKIGQDAALLVKLSRIGSHSLATDPSETNKLRWIDLSKRLLVPALSLTKSNAGVVTEVYELIKQFSTTTRYSIYAEWYSGSISRLPDIKAAFDQTRAETKDVLKRISKTNVKTMARALAKVATASPGIVFAVAIGQIESYDNLVEVVVECARYFTYLGYDVLTWSLMSSLGARGRNRVQADGMLTSKWLSALSLFAGKVFKRYSVMSPTPILQYVTEQLRNGNSTDLIVLEEITTSMAGIVSDTNFNEAQVLAMAGGDRLQAQTMLQLLDRRHESTSTAKRLMKSLVEPKLAGQLLISIAQERQTCIFKIPEPDAHLKLLGNLFDEIHRVLTQYLDLLRSRLTVKEFDSLVPNVSRLIGEFGIEPNVAFWIARPSIAANMKEYDNQISGRNSEKKEISEQVSDESVDKPDTEMAEADPIMAQSEPETPVTAEAENTDVTINGHGLAVDSDMTDVSHLESSIVPSDKIKGDDLPWHPVLREIMEDLKQKIPFQTWEFLSLSFYVTFWQLSLGDMSVPTQSYEDEINRQKKKILAINSDRSDISIAGTQKKDREKKALNELQDQLRAELRDQVSAYQQTRNRLYKEKEYWFANAWSKWDSLNVSMLEFCFFPRIMISPIDAIYTFKMFKFLHSTGAKNFRTMGLLDQLFNGKRLTAMFFLCTAKEAENFGRFLNEILKDLGRWHGDKALFEKEAYGPKKDLPGFSKNLTMLAFLDFEDFRRLLLKWHMQLHMALKTCFTGGEYMHIRNAVILLKAVFLNFPVINWIGQAQVASITELSKSELREDLKIAATSLLGNLRRREKDWVLPQAFSLNKAAVNGVNGHRSSSAKPPTSQPEIEDSKSLNANAPEFKPSDQISASRTSSLLLVASGKSEVEDEDGEINDHLISASEAKTKSPIEPSKHTDVDLEDASERTAPFEMLDEPSKPSKDANGEGAVSVTIVNPDSTKTTALSSQPLPFLPPDATLQQIRDVVPEQPSLPARSMRPELNRNLSDAGFHNRLAHGLPSRPEALPGPSRSAEQRFPDRSEERGRREPRDIRLPEHGHIERPTEGLRDRPGDRHVSAPFPRGYGRSERPPYDVREQLEPNWGGENSLPGRVPSNDRHGGPPVRDLRSSARDDRPDRAPRDRPYNESIETMRNAEMQGRSPRDISMGPPRPGLSQHPERSAQSHTSHDGDRGHLGSQIDRHNESARQDTHTNSQRSSRASSPSRRDEHRSSRHDHHSREDRVAVDNHRLPEDGLTSYTSRYEDSRPPTGPRTDRINDGPLPDQHDRFRETLRGPPPSKMLMDPNHGRLNQGSDNARQQDLQYGRLKPDVPLGPRMPNGAHAPLTRSSTRNGSGLNPSINTHVPSISQSSIPSPVGLDRQAPTGPSANRPPLRQPVPSVRPSPVSTSSPSTPVAESPNVAGVHPDRLADIVKHLNAPDTTTSVRTSAQGVPSPTSNITPAGPRAPHQGQSPSSLAPARPNQAPPTGPSFSGIDRSRGDKRFAGIQNVLQQAGTPNGPDRGSQGASIRGRGRQANSVPNPTSSPVTSGPPTSLNARIDQLPVRQDSFPPARADLFAGRGSGGRSTPQHTDEDLNHVRGGWHEDGDRRSGRYRGSRSHSRDRHSAVNVAPYSLPPVGRADDRPPRRGDEPREHRTRGGALDGPPMDIIARDQRRGGREDNAGKERERRAESDRRAEDWGASGRGLGSGGISGDVRGGSGEHRDDREKDRRDGPGRKRVRGPEDASMDFGDGSGKRSRRGV